MQKILVLGGVSFNSIIFLNDFPEPQPQTYFGQHYHETIGSTGAGKALNLRKLGFDVTLYGLIGDDRLGNQIKTYLAKEYVDFVYDIDPHGTERHFNLMDENGQRLSIILNAGKFKPEINLPVMEKFIMQSDHIALNIVSYCRALIPLLKKHDKDIWVDIHTYDGKNPYHVDFIDAADYLLLSSNDMAEYRQFMEHQIEQGKKLVICTHGKDGATALTSEKRWIDIPVIPISPVQDTNGAGDSFMSGALYGIAHGYPIEKCLQFGTVVAGLCVTEFELAYPDLDEEVLQEVYQKYYG